MNVERGTNCYNFRIWKNTFVVVILKQKYTCGFLEKLLEKYGT